MRTCSLHRSPLSKNAPQLSSEYQSTTDGHGRERFAFHRAGGDATPVQYDSWACWGKKHSLSANSRSGRM